MEYYGGVILDAYIHTHFFSVAGSMEKYVSGTFVQKLQSKVGFAGYDLP